MSENNNIEIKEVTKSSEELYNVMMELLAQLTTSQLSFSQKDLDRIVLSQNSILFTALDKTANNKIVGMLTLAIIDIPTGMRATIEDVVVDRSARGKGIGEKITLAAIEKAKELGIKKIDLTSSPSREAANRLYQRLGFKQRSTNVYRYEI
jgi:ribosomal protein S18 acetylase RimI-like enzyme